MADPSSYRPAPGTIPTSAGVYRFRDAMGRVVYVGKAKSLRSRLHSYFADLSALHPRTRQMVTTAASVEWTVVSTEVEALQLEYSWIKEYDPRFNVKYRDDKSYPSLAVTLHEDFPRLQVMRGPKRKGVRYFGPYAHAWAIRETLDLLLRVFPARTCSNGVFKRAGQVGRPCLLGYIDKCSAPCVGKVDQAEHRAIVDDFCDFMAGQSGRFVKRLERQMADAAQAQDYERAARLRDDIGALSRATEKQAVVLADGTDADVIGVAEDQLEAAVQVFHVRGGRVRGQRGFVVDKVEELSTGELVGQFLAQAYGDDLDPEGEVEVERRTTPGAGVTLRGTDDVPREVLVPALPPDLDVLQSWLAELRGTNVQIRVPQRGDKRALLETVERNATQAFALHKTKRASDLTARSQALSELQDALELAEAPLRIECFDVSHVQGTNVVASMVVFEDGLARKSEYRRFAVRGFDGNDDTASMREVVRRRFSRYLDERSETGQLDVADRHVEGEVPQMDSGPDQRPGIDPETGRPRRFAYPPNLVVVDGGAPQVAAAQAALDDLGVDDVALVGLAKRLEEVWVSGSDDPVILPRTSEGLYLLQRVRDEAHRFAIAYHRQKRSKTMTASALDGIAGLGETRRKALLRHFGSLKRLKAATVEEVLEVPGIGRRTAEAVLAALGTPEPVGTGQTTAPAFDPVTGEVVG
ncbi:MAG: excinuclease ABC subunit UvrC [Actinomycetota bacterium]|nr:excinuclease ABC subunit UvrC [Actinomycetota bacterium]